MTRVLINKINLFQTKNVNKKQIFYNQEINVHNYQKIENKKPINIIFSIYYTTE